MNNGGASGVTKDLETLHVGSVRQHQPSQRTTIVRTHAEQEQWY
jgi:hypothetical protein